MITLPSDDTWEEFARAVTWNANSEHFMFIRALSSLVSTDTRERTAFYYANRNKRDWTHWMQEQKRGSHVRD